MKIFSVTDPEFKPYGRVVTGLDTAKAEILAALANTPLPAATDYVAEDAALQELPAAVEVSEHLFGGMPCQLGWCNGHNTYLNCLEYHRDSEFNLGAEDFVLLLAKQEEIEDGKLDTAKVKAFRVPAGVLVEVYATTLHYAPCHTDAAKGFRVNKADWFEGDWSGFAAPRESTARTRNRQVPSSRSTRSIRASSADSDASER